MEPPHGRLGPLKEHLCVHKVPVQINEPMEEPEEPGAGARSPSPEYGDPMEAEVLTVEAEEAGAGARSPSLEYIAPESQSPSPEPRVQSPEHKTYYEPTQVDKSSHITQVYKRRKRSEERANSEARRVRQEPPRRWSRIPEHTSTKSSGNRGRRLSQDARCECWDCQHRLECYMAAIEELREESGRRRMRVQATWTPKVRSRTSPRTRSRDASRESRSPRSRTSSPTGHRKGLADGSSIPIHEWRRREARDKLLKETRKQVIKESRLIEMIRSPLMRVIRSGAKELRLKDEMKMMTQEMDSRIKEVLRKISGATKDDGCNCCILEDRGTARPRSRSVSPSRPTRML